MNRKTNRFERPGMSALMILLAGASACLLGQPAVSHAEVGLGLRAVAPAADEFEKPLPVGHFPHPPGGPMLGDGPAMMLPLLLFSGDLTDEQHEKVHEIMKGNRQTIAGLFAQLRTANDELAAKLLAPGTVAKADLQPTLDRIASIRQQLLDQGAKVALEVRALMTAEQIAKAAQVHERLEQLDEEKRKLLGRDVFIFEN